MSTEPHELVLLSQAQRLLAQVQTIDECREIRDRAEAVRNYAKKAGRSKEIVLPAAEVKLEAHRRIGQLLRRLPYYAEILAKQHLTISKYSRICHGFQAFTTDKLQPRTATPQPRNEPACPSPTALTIPPGGPLPSLFQPLSSNLVGLPLSPGGQP